MPQSYRNIADTQICNGQSEEPLYDSNEEACKSRLTHRVNLPLWVKLSSIKIKKKTNYHTHIKW